MAKAAHCPAICSSPIWPHKAPILIGPEALRVSDWWISEARQGGAGWGGAKRGGTGPGLVCGGIGIMSRARSHLRSALSLAAVSARGATTEGAARRWLSAWPAPQEPGMEYQVSDPRWGERSRMTRGLDPSRVPRSASCWGHPSLKLRGSGGGDGNQKVRLRWPDLGILCRALQREGALVITPGLPESKLSFRSSNDPRVCTGSARCGGREEFCSPEWKYPGGSGVEVSRTRRLGIQVFRTGWLTGRKRDNTETQEAENRKCL